MDNFRDSYFNVTWDLTKKHLRGTFWGKQYDTGRGFAVTIVEGGQVTVPSTETVRLKWEKPDSTEGYVTAVVVDDKFLIEDIDQMFTVHGAVRSDLEIWRGGKVISSITFYVSVEKAVAVDAIESSSQFTALQEALANVDDVQDQVDAVIANATVDSEVILARGTEPTLGARLAETDQRIDAIITTPVPTGEIIAQEIIDARQGEGSVGTNLDRIKTNLEEISPKGFRNADVPLYIPTYEGSGQLVHPKVLHFPSHFGGHPFWMAATPYPNTNDFYENPCVYYSDDMINWTGIPGNPIADVPTTNEHQADTHLLMVNGIMEIWWMYRNKLTDYRCFYRSTSTDGLNWTPKEKFYETTGYVIASPVGMYFDNKYRMYLINELGQLEVYESLTGILNEWTLLGKYNIGFKTDFNYIPWHMDIVKTDLGYEMVFCAYKQATNHSTNRLYYARSTDGLTFNGAELILDKSYKGFDNKTIYRATFVKINGMYYMFYSATDNLNRWRIGLNYGSSLKATSGLQFIQEIQFINGVDTIEKVPGSRTKIVYKSDGTIIVNFALKSKSIQSVDMPAPGDVLLKMPTFFKPSEQITFAASIQKAVADTSYIGAWGIIGWDGTSVVIKVYSDGSKIYRVAGFLEYPLV